ncbi:MAG TPA: Ig-like domain-containing protein [Vitreimonas sp.]|nr:Ig-like domain-containing protein [Vitreimonas sp.]
MSARHPRTAAHRVGTLTTHLLFVFFSVFFGLGSGFLGFSVQAQDGGIGPGEDFLTNPKIREVNVTATVPDNLPPTAPVLISPNNNSYVTINKPSFVWQASSDDNGISHYKMSLDGVDYIDNIPTTATDNATYTLTYNAVSDEYTLTPKTGLSEGTHTWKIRGTDTLGNGSDSATWTFTIDTQAPAFVITQLGTATTSISSQDISTIPSTPLELSANEPLLVGTGEANSSVQLTVSIPDDPTQNFSFSITGSSTWEQQLGILPRDVTILLDFVITDLAGNVSILSNVPFTIPSPVIIFPPASASPSPSPTPSPAASTEPGASPSPTPEVFPNPSPSPSPLIVIPYIPPREVAHSFTQELAENLSFLTDAVPAPIRETVAEVANTIAPTSGLIVATSIPLISTVAVASQFGWSVSPDLIIKILQALGLLPAGKPQGLVYDSETRQPIAFVVLTITSQDPEHLIKETVVTDADGVYRGFKLPPGKYILEANQQEYRFPTRLARPPYLSMNDFYKGEVFTVTQNNQDQLFLIPMDRLTELPNGTWKSKGRIFLAQINRRLQFLALPLFLFSGFLALLYPSIWNWLVFGFYCFLLGRTVLDWFKTPQITGTAIDEFGTGVKDAVIRIGWPETNELVKILLTDKNGNFKAFLAPGEYQMTIIKLGYVWYEKDAPMSLYQVKASDKPVNIVAALRSTESLYKELFG